LVTGGRLLAWPDRECSRRWVERGSTSRNVTRHTKHIIAKSVPVLYLSTAVVTQQGPRAVRERLDWNRIRSQTADNDYAVSFLVLADRLGLTG